MQIGFRVETLKVTAWEDQTQHLKRVMACSSVMLYTRKENGVLYEFVFSFGAMTLMSHKFVILTTAAKSRVLISVCFAMFFASSPKGWTRSFPFRRCSQSLTWS